MHIYALACFSFERDRCAGYAKCYNQMNLCGTLIQVRWLTALACCCLCCCAANQPSSTVLHGFQTMPSALGITRAGRPPVTTGRPVVHPTPVEQRPPLDARGMPACAAPRSGDIAYCVEDDSYPVQIVRTVIRSLNVNMSDEVVEERGLPSHEDGIDQNVCPSRIKTIFPKTARSAEGEWLYVINDVTYVQAIIVEVCVHEDSPCDFAVHSGLPSGYTSECEQKFALRKLLALHPTEEKAYGETFRFPSCCVCYIRSPKLAGRSLKPSRRRN
ncbi:protein spaetzle-like [Dermacentor andersoni]|uniref:protein spaetzle-like n=1 Tax=Dermacentor andersoni TaxID=34620 RepID=UPI002416B550|nr:protein spaetzle-like [Dermacentor andersoni]